MSKSIDSMLAVAVSLLGTHETNGDNINKVTEWFGENGQPWCDMTVTYEAYHSGNQAAVCFNAYHDYTVEHAQAFKDHGQWHVGATGIQRGDIVFFDWEGSNNLSDIDHVGIVEFVDATGVNCIEGNIDNVCKRTVRHEDFIAGYGRPLYANDPVTTPPPPPPPIGAPPLPKVSLANMITASNGSTSYETQVTRVQNALAKLGFLGTTQRGPWGPLTTSAYAAYQRSLGYNGSDADGHPGATSLTKLGTKTGLFTETA